MVNGTVIRCTEKGSMNMEMLIFFIQHFNCFIRKSVPLEKHGSHGSRLFDGNSCTTGMGWIKLCVSLIIQVINPTGQYDTLCTAVRQTCKHNISDYSSSNAGLIP